MSMPRADVDAIVRELNTLLDQQLAFLDSDLNHLDRSAWLEYDRRYGQIRTLCEQLDLESPSGAGSHPTRSVANL